MRYRCYGFLSVLAFLLVNLLSCITTIGRISVCFKICTNDNNNKQQLPQLNFCTFTCPHLTPSHSHPSHLTSPCCYPLTPSHSHPSHLTSPHLAVRYPLSLTPFTPFTPPHCHPFTYPQEALVRWGQGWRTWSCGTEAKNSSSEKWTSEWQEDTPIVRPKNVKWLHLLQWSSGILVAVLMKLCSVLIIALLWCWV